MNTRAHLPLYCSLLYQEARSWTEDLPVCKNSGVGLSTNVVYREDDHRQEDHEFEDRSFHIKYNDKISLYGVFDGHDGVQFAKYAVDTITAEILLELDGKKSDKEVKQILKQAFNTVEKNYLEAIGDKLAEKASLQMEIPEGVTPYEAYQKFPAQIEKLKTINTELSCGTTAVVSLICDDRLYVANVGDCRALICKTDADGVLKVIPLSQDHNLTNEDEILRLVNLGMPLKNIRKGFRFGNHENTRCLGNYLVKGGYKEYEELSCASAEPVIAEPEITDGKPLDKSYRFLMLMSSGLYRSLEEATGTPSVNKDIAQMVVEQFRIQSTLTGVAQAVVDKVVRLHHDAYMSRTGSEGAVLSNREDITLLIRNFNFPLPHAISPVSCPSVNIEMMQPREESLESSPEDSNFTVDSKESTIDSSQTSTEKSVSASVNSVKPYVDFSGYFAEVEKARMNGDLPRGIEFF